MCKTFSSFEQLGNVMKDMTRVDATLFDTLSDDNSQDVDRKRALKELRSKVSSILRSLEAKDYLLGPKTSLYITTTAETWLPSLSLLPQMKLLPA